ncbi:MAG: BCAM0308 family protein [Dehalococcoidia bacterium]
MPTSKPGEYKNLPVDRRRHDTIVPEAGHDPYAEIQQPPAGTVCEVCGLKFENGRWTWPGEGRTFPARRAESGAPTQVCPACRRTRDNYPAGFVSLSGAFVSGHLAEILEVVEQTSAAEIEDHPLNRVIELTSGADRVDFTTTDLHLARRVGEAVRDLFEGELAVDYLADGHQVRVGWVRDDLPPLEPAEPAVAPLVEVMTRDIHLTPDLQSYLDERIARLPEFYDRIISSRVIVGGETRHHREGGPFSVHIHIDVPQRVISVTRQKRANLHVAIREAFDAAQRQLQDLARKQRGEVSPTEQPPRGEVARVFPNLGYGFIDTPEGDVYFHKNAVLMGRFDEIEPGMSVRYELEQGLQGLQASTVALPGD